MNNINNFDDIINNWLEVITNNENDLINYINTTFSKEEIEKHGDNLVNFINLSKQHGMMLKMMLLAQSSNSLHTVVDTYKNSSLIRVKAMTDDCGHWYVLPIELCEDFNKDLTNEDLVDSGDFDNRYSKYQTGGDLNIIQLFADI